MKNAALFIAATVWLSAIGSRAALGEPNTPDVIIKEGNFYEYFEISQAALGSPTARVDMTGGQVGTGDPREDDGMYVYDSGTLNMSGGWAAQLQTFDAGTVNLSGGYVGEVGLYHFAFGSSTINVFEGGALLGMSFSHLELYDSATLNVHGGIILLFVLAHDTSRVNVYGGDVYNMLSNDNTVVNVYGGHIKTFWANVPVPETATVNIYGYGFEYEPEYFWSYIDDPNDGWWIGRLTGIGPSDVPITYEGLPDPATHPSVNLIRKVITVDDNAPADFDNIQAAISAATDGDIIEVRPGIYTGPGNRDIDFLGKAITVRSADPNDPSIVAATVVQGSKGTDGLHRGFAFRNGEGRDSVLAGLTIRNFYAPAEPFPTEFFGDEPLVFGGGIFCQESSPIISRCVVESNQAYHIYTPYMTYSFGGGIFTFEGNPMITHCIVRDNLGRDGGGGIYCWGSAIITHTTVEDNTGYFGVGGIKGGTVIADSIIIHNAAGGIQSDGLITGCIIAENSTDERGGGVRGSPTIKDCIISGNSVVPGRGGGLYCLAGTKISNCIVENNRALSGIPWPDYWIDGEGGGIYCEDPNVEIDSTTIVGNFAEARGGGIYGRPTIANCIIWDNNSPNEPQIFGNPDISYSDVEGGYVGAGNIDIDPLFADPNDGDYHLQSEAGRWYSNSGDWVVDSVTSPCIDAGDPMSPIALEPFPNGGIVNMGAYGGTAEASRSYFDKPPCQTIIAGDINGDCTIDFQDFRLMALHWCIDNEP